MPLRTQTKEAQFSEIVGTKISLFILRTEADQRTSMRFLENARVGGVKVKLRPLEKEEIHLLMGDMKLIASLTNNGSTSTWFYIAGKGLGKEQGVQSSGYYTLSEERKLVKGQGLSPEETIDVYSGKWPLSLGVDSDVDTAIDGGRFVLDADGWPDFVARMVVGVRIVDEATASKQAIRS